MLGLFRKGTLLGDELTELQFACCNWLLRYTGGVDALSRRRIVFPTSAFFPGRPAVTHAFAESIFQQTRQHAGMADWACRLEAQEDDPNPLVAPTLLVQNAPNSPAGTFRTTQQDVLITYHPKLLSDPMSLIATFAHELAHYRTAGFAEPPPGGWEVWEPVTDLAAVFLGFGIFLSNSRFSFSQHSDGQTMGWRWRQQGYLSEPELLHMHAIVVALLGAQPSETLAHLKPSLRGVFKRVWKDVNRAPDALARLRATVAEPQHSVA
jgi:hypothetical protein